MHHVCLVFTFIILIDSIELLEDRCYIINTFIEVTKSDTCLSDHRLNLVSNFNKWRLSRHQTLEETFPLDTESLNFVRRVSNCLFSVVKPVPLNSNVILAAVSADVLTEILDLDPSVAYTNDFTEFVSGGKLLATPLSHRYGGHQFGSWAGQLGDGRAVMIGEYVNQEGVRYELQLKGSGRTPYSRRGDGRAVIRSSVREFLCSEAMHHLGIPTSRAASLVVSDDPVVRDMFYDGYPKTERAAIVLRLAKSWFRIGSLEILTDAKEYELLKNLTDFVIENYFPKINISDHDRVLHVFSEVVNQTAHMIVQWQSVGFTHGVCNTDNFSLLSITIDYGPFGFMEEYDPGFVPNTSDDEGRYSYEKQPDVGYFNLNKLRLALAPLLSRRQQDQAMHIINGYVDIYKTKFMETFLRKLGLTVNKEKKDDDEQIIAVLLKMMQETRSDFTMTLRQLSEINLEELSNYGVTRYFWALKSLSRHRWYKDWVSLYQKRFGDELIPDKERQDLMQGVNPRYVLRNWIAQHVIDKVEDNDFTELHTVLRILTNPYKYQDEAENLGLADIPPAWSKKLKVSCSS